MMNTIVRTLSACLLAAGLTACEPNEGPAEEAGEKVDEALEETREQIEESAETAGEKVEEAADQLREKTGQ